MSLGAAGIFAVAIAGCVDEPPEDAEFRSTLVSKPGVAAVPAPLPAAHCDVMVEGAGVIDLEVDYLPYVVNCENGAAEIEALKAQAVAARSVAYYSMETDGFICDSQMCQVYSCGSNPLPKHFQAVEETSGIYLKYEDVLTYGFYVAGDAGVQPPGCVGQSGSTENFVTYNEGQSGTNVEQTTLGLVSDPGDSLYGQNRGCMSQNGAMCLEENNNYDYRDILRFFYGQDIEIIQAQGECILDGVESVGESTGGGEDTGDESTTGGGSASASATASTTASTTATASGTASASGGSGVASADDGDDTTGDEDGGTGAGDDANDGLPDTFGGDAPNEKGCGCTAQRQPSAYAWLLLPLFARRRRRG